jgi:dipeptidyl aminopeptidase/acylaminoacyl peptidase
MRNRIAVASLVLLVPSFAPGEPLTPARYLKQRRVSDLQFSPSGDRLVLTVREAISGRSTRSHLWILKVADERLWQLTRSANSETSPLWSPDGSRLGFLSDQDGSMQLQVVPSDGGTAIRLTDRTQEIRSFQWSPDGSQIAFLAQAPSAPQEQDAPRVVGQNRLHPQLWVLDTISKRARPLTKEPWSVKEMRWIAPGNLLVIATNQPEGANWAEKIYSVAVPDGTITERFAPDGPVSSLEVSPDRQMFTFLGSRLDGPVVHDLYLADAHSDRPPRNLTGNPLDRPVWQSAFRDKRSLLALVQDGFHSRLANLTFDGTATYLPRQSANPGSFALGANGAIAYVGQSATQPQELWLEKKAGEARKVSAFNADWDIVELIRPEIVRYASNDGTPIEAALLKPKGWQAGQRLPLIVLVHGGPDDYWDDSIDNGWAQLLAARGYAVLSPNIRGSFGYGWRFFAMNRADWGGGDFQDLMAGVDGLIKKGIADPNRLGIGGWSYGGYMAAWAITQTRRFKAAVVGAPMTDLVSEFGTEGIPAKITYPFTEWYWGVPYEHLDRIQQRSPITHVRHARTPTLILRGEDDDDSVFSQGMEFYRGLRRYGVKTEFVMYPREGHNISEEQHLLDVLTRMLSWFDSELKRE